MSQNSKGGKVNTRIHQLYQKLVDRTISQEELKEWYSLVNQDSDGKLLEKEMHSIWENPQTELKGNELQQHISETQTAIRDDYNKTKIIHFWSKVAAGALILIVSVLLLTSQKNTSYYSTDFGERISLELPDGSIVELNAHSDITWDNNWEETGIRKVSVNGEVYFDVKHLNGNQKFRVKTNDLEIEVLGTSFNVSTRSDKTEVFLKEGKVKLGFQGRESISDTLYMVPGQKVSYSKDGDRVEKDDVVNGEKEVGWTKGVLYFEDKSVDEILDKVSQLYGFQYEIPDSILADKKMNFGVPYGDWESTKQAFELTMRLRIEQENGNVYMVRKAN
ncbi:FecR family protein [Membranihabitans marinus]|uniref:FecR family protein n=1 Tax=Membranihabitans marinus TaxID=1227546 RepID=UPI001F36F66D|nr:FecR domain-containing protein [Membranihabitans marinus]